MIKFLQIDNMTYPLKGITVLEMEGLAPTVFAGQILADFGADVTIISKPKSIAMSSPFQLQDHSILNRGKKSITIDLKDPIEIKIFG